MKQCWSCMTSIIQPLCLLTYHSAWFHSASRVWMTDFLFDIMIYYLFTISGYTKSLTLSSLLLPLEWLAFRLWPAWDLAGLYDISTSVSVCRCRNEYISKVSWVCQTCMITTPQSLCAAAGKSTYVTYNVSWTCRPCIFILKVYVKNVL